MADATEMSLGDKATLRSAVSEPAVRQANESGRSTPSIGELFANLSTQITSLVRGEIELTKAKATAYVTKMGMGIGLFVGAALFALYLLGWIFHTIELALAVALPAWAASLIVAGILLVIVLVLALLGKAALGKAKDSTPDPKSGVNASIDAVKKGLNND